MDRYLILVCTAIAATPATILLFLIVLIESKSGISEETQNLAELIIQGISAVATLATAIVAVKALSTWKKSKKFEIKLKADKELEEKVKTLIDFMNSLCNQAENLNYCALGLIDLDSKTAVNDLIKNCLKIRGVIRSDIMCFRYPSTLNTDTSIQETYKKILIAYDKSSDIHSIGLRLISITRKSETINFIQAMPEYSKLFIEEEIPTAFLNALEDIIVSLTKFE